jgi:lysophospholipase L1-like esterase
MTSTKSMVASLVVLAGVFCAFGPGVGEETAARPAASMPTTGGAAKLVLKKGDLVAIAGDSITEQRLYSRIIEDYLVACRPDLDLSCIQLGWSGEKATGFLGRIDRDCLEFKPNVLTTCYGMNDGGYRALDDQRRTTYRDAMNGIITRAKAAGVTVVAGGPGTVDSTTYHHNAKEAAEYNVALGELGDIVKGLAVKEGTVFADVHGTMRQSMAAAKEAFGQDYVVCGGDGVHPGVNGHYVMAYAFLKAMGLDGNIGTITVDMAGAAKATEGHKVLSAKGGTVELESTRYPFCLPAGLEGASDSVVKMMKYVPFDQDLNRLTLVVENLKDDKAKVTWGDESKTFTKEQLAQGVNLAAEFRKNPFCEAFGKIDQLVTRKQAYETCLVKGISSNLATMMQLLGTDFVSGDMPIPQDRPFVTAMFSRDTMMARSLHGLVTPVKHTIKIEGE